MIEHSMANVGKLSISRLASTGAFAVGIIFAICWTAAASGILGSHNFIGLFTLAPTASGAALLTGGICAVVFGALAGALVGVGYNVFGRSAAR